MDFLFYIGSFLMLGGFFLWAVVNFSNQFRRGESWYKIAWISAAQDIRDVVWTVSVLCLLFWYLSGGAFSIQ